MAKVIRYSFLSSEVNRGTEDNPDIQQVFLEKTLTWSEGNEAIAKKEAYQGRYTVEDDGRPAPAENTEDIVNALLGVTA